MRLTFRGALASLLVLAIAVPYVGYLINGSMPFIQDPRGMSGAGLALGVLAFLAIGRPAWATRVGKTEWALGVVSLGVGITALLLAEAAAAEVLLAVFMATILVVAVVEALDRTGVIAPEFRRASGVAHR